MPVLCLLPTAFCVLDAADCRLALSHQDDHCSAHRWAACPMLMGREAASERETARVASWVVNSDGSNLASWCGSGWTSSDP